jgi:hypothetical protein
MRGVIIIHKEGANSNSKHAGILVQLHVNFSENVRTLPKSHMHIFNMSITTMQRFEELCQSNGAG